MYKIEYLKDGQLNIIKMTNTYNNSYAKLALNNGASLHELCLNDTMVIEDLSPLKYTDTYASSILFPFANRIKDGLYSFNGEEYQLEINHKKENNAIHGLVYDKTFKVVNEYITDHEAVITLEYEEINKSKGFPFTYTIRLIYTLKDNGIKLNVSIKNTDSKPFPFTLGWHPYFICENLYESHIEFKSNKKLVLDKRMITTGVENHVHHKIFEVKNKTLDDCFILKSNAIKFTTPGYDLEMTASSNQTFLQLYTPPKANTIAIEPTTGVSDSFNNKMGLQVLNPGESYSIDWEIKLTLNMLF